MLFDWQIFSILEIVICGKRNCQWLLLGMNENLCEVEPGPYMFVQANEELLVHCRPVYLSILLYYSDLNGING